MKVLEWGSLAIAALLCTGSTLAQAQTFKTGSELEAEKKAKEKSAVGQHLWYSPGTSTVKGRSFAKSLSREDLAQTNRLYPTAPIALEVLEKIPDQYYGYYYKVRFSNGTEAFIECLGIDNWISDYTLESMDASDAHFINYNLDTEGFFKVNPDELRARLQANQSAQRTKNKAVAERAKRDEQARIARGPARIGMTAEQVKASSWGSPDKVNKTILSGHVQEQWVYGYSYLYFDDGQLTSIQTSE